MANPLLKHLKSDLKMKILNDSQLHKDYILIGLIDDGIILMTCHIHKFDLSDWEEVEPFKKVNHG